MTTIPPQQQEELLVIDRQETQGAILLRPTGEVDLTSVPVLWSNLKALLEDGQHVVVDLSAIQSMDATGFEALLDCGHLFFQRGQRFVLANPTRIVQGLLDIVGLDEVIPVFESIEAALDPFCGASRYSTEGSQTRHRARPVRWPANA
jgi:anti-anti-sigma factor